jgi:L-threonylcarbamoyladenylate synthase
MQNIYPPTPETYLKAKELLTNDQLVAFPTETIYGLGASALSDTAAKKIFELKGRPNDNPLIVHLGEKSQISDYAFIENEIQQKIIDKLMPGPITLLLRKKDNISPIVCPVPLVGIRLPSNEIAQKMLTTVGVPIAAPSANISGKASPTNAQMVYDNLGERVPMIIDGGESEAGIESTVVRVIAPPDRGVAEGGGVILILRPGFVTKEDLEECFDGEIEVEYTTTNPELSPGMRYKHYSISGQVKLISSIEGNRELSTDNQKIGYLITQEFFDENQHFFSSLPNNILVQIRGTHQNLATCAHNLFDMYHYFDQQNVDILYVEKLPEVGIGYSIMNRVKRSAEIH